MKYLRALILGVALLSTATAAQAATLTFDFEHVISGNTPDGTPPWLSATFADTSEGVLLTLAAAGITGQDFITEWNFNSTLGDLTGLDYLYTNVTGVTELTILSAGLNDAVLAGTGARYDLGLRFATANNQGGVNRFKGGDLATVLLFGLDDLTAESFNALSSPASKAYLAEAKIQGIGADAQGSSWIVPDPGPAPVPEPGTMILLGAGAFGLAIYGKRRKNA